MEGTSVDVSAKLAGFVMEQIALGSPVPGSLETGNPVLGYCAQEHSGPRSSAAQSPVRESLGAGKVAAAGSVADGPGMETPVAANPVALAPRGTAENREAPLGLVVMVGVPAAATQQTGYRSPDVSVP